VKLTWLVIVMDSRSAVPVMVNGKQSIAIRDGQETVMVAVCALSWFPVNRSVVGEKVTVTPGGKPPAVSATWRTPEPARPTAVTL
jgi:hypothetical protein